MLPYQKLQNENENYYLYPGAFVVPAVPTKVTTVLGSCVAVCLWDPVLKIGGINHFMLPLWNGKGLPTARYGNVAIEKMLNEMLRKGAVKRNMVAKIFGGAHQLNRQTDGFLIGKRNAELAVNILEEARIRIATQQTGGSRGRHLQFFSHTGEVLMRYVQTTKT